jgi:deazaflavin-dependent oxidoreductase (nitroreductase family)
MNEPKQKSGPTAALLKEVIEEMHTTGKPGAKNQEYNEALIAEYRATGGRSIGHAPPNSVVLITMKGAKSGLMRTTPVGVQEIDGRLIIVASQGGLPKHPQWYHNLMANPIVTAEWQGQTFRAKPVVTEGADRERLIAQLHPVFHSLQARTTRVFPVIELRRINDA